MSYLIAIDPATRSLGLAIFYNKKLIKTKTIRVSGDDRATRTRAIVQSLIDYLSRALDKDFEKSGLTIVCEEPLLRGKGNKAMERLLGQFEYIFNSQIHYFSPTTVKSAMGSGSLDKMEVALAAGQLLKTEAEQEILADAIAREAWDETDAVAIGLTYFLKEGSK